MMLTHQMSPAWALLVDTSSANLKSVNIISLPFTAGTRAASAPDGTVRSPLWWFGGDAGRVRPIDKVAPTSATVLITGESGSGKDLVAPRSTIARPRPRAVHRGELRRDSRGDRGRTLRT
jgi:hypothetical protein